MDERVNDFFNEINEILPPVKKQIAKECAWQECFDDKSGYPYYWNINTNAVTWEMPAEYQEWLSAHQIATPKTVTASGYQPKPLFPSVSDVAASTKCTPANTLESNAVNREIKKIPTASSSLVDSDQDSPDVSSRNGSILNSPRHSNNSKTNSRANSDTEGAEEVKPTLGFSLLASYGSGSDEETDEEDKEGGKCTETLSTLFPAPEPIDVNQFKEEKAPSNDHETETEVIDSKAFKRKRRIGVHLDNRPKGEASARSTEGSNDARQETKKIFAMAFVKGDTLQPSSEEKKRCDSTDTQDKQADLEIVAYRDRIDPELQEKQTVLKEKLAFLSVGRDTVGPVQVMLIQLETLFEACKSGDLKSSYLAAWITSTCSELIQLEDVATPEGWTLEWDRAEKRYFYRNKKSNGCQWEYPQCADVPKEDSQDANREANKTDSERDNDDDAMDICTTPPPSDAPISGAGIEVISITASATEDSMIGGTKESNQRNMPDKVSMDFNSVLDSFYSDIAAIETAANVSQENQSEGVPVGGAMPKIGNNNKTNDCQLPETDADNHEPAKKKKKVKMSHGISMKKKGVSQLVEKWKNMQKELE